MGGEGDLEVGVELKMQISVKDVVVVVIPEIVQKQVQVGGNIREAFVADVDKIEANLEKTILMIKTKKTNVIPILVSEEENTNEDVELHAQIDGGDILNFLYNSLPTHPVKWVFFCRYSYCSTFVNFAP
jgi:hypothetical protein